MNYENIIPNFEKRDCTTKLPTYTSYTMKSVFVWVVTSVIHDEAILHSAFETEKEALAYAGKSGDGWHNVQKVYLKTEQVPLEN